MSRGKILVVEDDTNLLAGIRDILELEDYEILVAEDGTQALQVLSEMSSAPDLIVSDIMMPHMDGIEFLSQVRDVDRFITIPFIFLTAKGERADIQRGKLLGVDDYVVKPFNAEDLLIAIESRLNRHRSMDKVNAGREAELKRSILTILNHEFRTPLTFVVAYADMLNDYTSNGKEAPGDGEILTFLQGVKNGADRLRRLIENFILLVELETGSAAKTYAWRKTQIGDVKSLLIAASDRGTLLPEEKRDYSIHIDDPIPIFTGDIEYLQAAMSHLVENACKFSSLPVEVGAYADDTHVCMWVRDFGRGITPQEQEEVWRTFYQINRPLYEDQGTGSGLAIVQGVAQLHNGFATLESEEGVGSLFTLHIPYP